VNLAQHAHIQKTHTHTNYIPACRGNGAQHCKQKCKAHSCTLAHKHTHTYTRTHIHVAPLTCACLSQQHCVEGGSSLSVHTHNFHQTMVLTHTLRQMLEHTQHTHKHTHIAPLTCACFGEQHCMHRKRVAPQESYLTIMHTHRCHTPRHTHTLHTRAHTRNTHTHK